MGKDNYNPIVVPESIEPDDSSDELGSLGQLGEGEEKKDIFSRIKDAITPEITPEQKEQMMRQAILEHFVRKTVHGLPKANHPTKKRLTKAERKKKRKAQKRARRRNRNKNKRGMKTSGSRIRSRKGRGAR